MMENNENLVNETGEEPVLNTTAAEQESEPISSDVSESTGNLDICPNCLEPNTEDLAVCKYCGMPLHQGAEADEFIMKAEEANLETNRAEAAKKKKKTVKKQESGFRRVMPWLGLYLIYYAITGFFDVKRQIQQAVEAGQPVNEKLAYFSQVIWLAAGLLMAWPLIKKGYRKLRHLPDPDEAEAAEENAETTEGTEAEAETETGPDPESTDSLPEPELTDENETAAEDKNGGPEA